MKTYKKVLLFIFILAAVFLAGCGRSDVVLTVNEDGSFTADVNYGITRALMGNEEVEGQVKALITDTLSQNNIPYTESENDEYVIISVERTFKDINELTSADAWHGMSFVPNFSSVQAQGGLWTRYEDGKLKISGTLDSETFKAKELLEQNGMETSFGGSLTIVLPEAAEEYGDAEADGTSYKWGGNGGESKEVNLVSAQIFAVDENGKDEADGESSTESGSSAVVGVVAVVLAAAIIAVCVLMYKKRKKTEAETKSEE
ncbi:MAG: hypothetical protein ACI4SS_06265 [Clostridia bacterium]